MTSLPPPDLRHLQAAIGWLELGEHLEADKELDNITPDFRGHPDVLGVRWQVYARAGKWKACVELAHAVVKMDPDRLAAWMDRATGLRHADGLQAAYESIMPALVRFPRSPLVPYTLARYTCQMPAKPSSSSQGSRREKVHEIVPGIGRCEIHQHLSCKRKSFSWHGESAFLKLFRERRTVGLNSDHLPKMLAFSRFAL